MKKLITAVAILISSGAHAQNAGTILSQIYVKDQNCARIVMADLAAAGAGPGTQLLRNSQGDYIVDQYITNALLNHVVATRASCILRTEQL